MDLIDTLRSTGAVRAFEPEPIPDETLARVLDTARFAPNGGNQQSWHIVVLADPARRAAFRDIYLRGWSEYLAQRAAGLTPWAPITDDAAETGAIEAARAGFDERPPFGDFVEHLDEVPVLLAVFADLRKLAATDRDLGRYTIVGGASVYPFVWSILLAGRAEGLGGVVTTVPIVREPEVKELLGVPEEFAMAALVAMGRPVHQNTKLRRGPVAEFASIDTFTGPPLPDPTDS